MGVGTARMNSNGCHAQFALYVLCKLETLLGGRVNGGWVGKARGGGVGNLALHGWPCSVRCMCLASGIHSHVGWRGSGGRGGGGGFWGRGGMVICTCQ
jgi:hypothetical protein